MTWQVVIGVAVGLLACWLALVVALVRPAPRVRCSPRRCASLPNLLRMLRRLAADRTAPGVCGSG